MPSEGELVRSGAFKVDRARAVEKLRLHQLAEPESFLVWWVRAAVASGARELRLDEDGSSAVLRFDADWEPAQFEDPLEAALGGDGRPPWASDFAIGLLAAPRAGVAEVLLTGGSGASRRTLRLPSEGTAHLGPAKRSGEGTALSAAWPGSTARRLGLTALPRPLPEAIERVRSAARFVPGSFAIRGEAIVRFLPPARRWSYFNDGGATGFVWRPERAEGARIELCAWGLKAAELELGPLGFHACVNNDRLTLDVSGGGIVRDDVFQRTVDYVLRLGKRRGAK